MLLPILTIVAALALDEPRNTMRAELTLFDSEGAATAYIDSEDELTIYLWDGSPVAYLDPEGDQFSIYGFNGAHLGWLVNGVVRDHQGYAVGFLEGAALVPTQYEPYKSYKKYKPYRSYKKYAPYMPTLRQQWSSTPLSLFLAAGQKD